MDWLAEVQARMKRNNQILFAQSSPFLGDLTTLINSQTHQTLILWAFDLADETAATLRKRYPNENRPEQAVRIAKDWAAGKVKMRVAQRAILQAHAVAKEISSPEDIALCHAVGQACGVVHTPGHAMGFPIYDLTAIIRRCGVPDCKLMVERRLQEYTEKIHHWQQRSEDSLYEWADFIRKG